MKHDRKEPLYRKVNTKAHNVHHNIGKDASRDRNTKNGMSTKMKRHVERGLDYTPLYRFLHSKVGQNFDKVYSESVSRLDSPDAINHIVLDPTNLKDVLQKGGLRPFVISGESSYYSSMFVDRNGDLQFVDPSLKNEDFAPGCTCCTHTFNGKPFLRKYQSEQPENLIR